MEAIESSIEELSSSVCISLVQMKRQKKRARQAARNRDHMEAEEEKSDMEAIKKT